MYSIMREKCILRFYQFDSNSIHAPYFSGKPPNEFAFDGRPKERDFALKVVGDVHDQWKALMRREESGSVVRDAIQCCREIVGH